MINLEKRTETPKSEKLDEFGLSRQDYINFLKYVKPVKRRTRRAKANQSFC